MTITIDDGLQGWIFLTLTVVIILFAGRLALGGR